MNVDPAHDWLLVVEDNEDIWQILKMLLPRALPQATIVHAPDAPTALSLLTTSARQAQTPPRLILQNLYLPERVTGLSLLKQLTLTASPQHQVPIVVMSSSTDLQDLAEVQRLGARYFLTKPTTLESWMQALQELRRYWEPLTRSPHD